jgi:hypothetical protein
LSIPVSEKPTRDNYRLWCTQVLPEIHAAQLEGFLDGPEKAPEKNLEIEKDSKKLIVPNPDYAVWRVHDQHVLTYLVTSLSREVLAGVASNAMAATMWAAISRSFASQSWSRVLHLCNQLVVMHEGDMSIASYFLTMRGYVDEMAATGKPLDDDDVVSYILNGLDADYSSLIEQVNGMTKTISLETLYSQLLDTKARVASQKMQREQYHMVDNAAARGGGGRNRQANRSGYHGNRTSGGGSNSNHNNGGGGRPGNPNNRYKDHQCQVYGKLGHTALRCWKRFDKNYNGPDKVASAASTSYNLDPAWYADSAATDHITGDLDKLIMRENYGGNDQVHAANGSGMTIKHVSHSAVSTPHRRILLKNVLHVLQTTRNLASVHRLTADNDVFLELHPTFFLVKDRSTRRTLLHGPCKNGLYPYSFSGLHTSQAVSQCHQTFYGAVA